MFWFLRSRRFFHKQRVCKQRQAEIGKKSSKSNTLRWSFCYYSHSSWMLSSKKSRTQNTFKKKKNNKCVCIHKIIWLIIVNRMMKIKNRSHRHDINSPMSRHIVNIRLVLSVLYILSNTLATFKKFNLCDSLATLRLSWKKASLFKKACISLAPLMIPLAVDVKAYLIYFLFRPEFEVAFGWIMKKNQFFWSKFRGF